MKNNSEKMVVDVLKKNGDGLTIAEMVSDLNSSRSTVRVVLAKLEGLGRVDIRKIGMAKLYKLRAAK